MVDGDSGGGDSGMIDVKDLAKLAIEVLDAQQRYFKDRTRDNLIASKQLESELRKRANAALEQ